MDGETFHSVIPPTWSLKWRKNGQEHYHGETGLSSEGAALLSFLDSTNLIVLRNTFYLLSTLFGGNQLGLYLVRLKKP